MVGTVSLRNYSGQVEELIEYPVRKPIVSSCSLMVDLGHNAVIAIKITPLACLQKAPIVTTSWGVAILD